ncbi:hypothetical protein [Natronosalvus rutilus]|uniref:Uncharacterized protein n=1 Tax=Natronosalvus rutilus TaxID=2953753 RepID=A0A9E7N980_9EURY|nr:hypothetical protein [Natronosalvus rutilus]UTF52432.1 hypothetical protein NGM29_11595 [Natronosalvus rutilus]
MTDRTSSSVYSFASGLCRRTWNDVLSVYYANTPIWRVLKSVGLLFFGFFCWSASNLLLSYRPSWSFLYFVAAYGFALIVWGPLTHLALLPWVIRLRRTANHPLTRTVARKGSMLNLSIFLTIVLVLGIAPISPMLLDFGTLVDDGTGSPDVDPDLECTVVDELVECSLSDPSGIDHVVVTSGEVHVKTVEEPPYDFEIRRSNLETVLGQKQFTVELRDEDGATLRRYKRTVPTDGE